MPRYPLMMINAGNNYAKHDPKSPLLVGSLEIDDKVNDRKVKSLKQNQFSLF